MEASNQSLFNSGRSVMNINVIRDANRKALKKLKKYELVKS
jgi:hypothetical protein